MLESTALILKNDKDHGSLKGIVLKNVYKRFGRTEVLKNINLEIERGSLFAILGPSGCGKTTLLRIIAGFIQPDKGKIYINGVDVTDKPPHERRAVMVFQNWALWPHMTVYENIAFGLRLRKVPKEEIDRKVRWALELLGLEGLENRYPSQLSGGQQQRVALARALVVDPEVLLLDEPLSNLDAKLRIKLRAELKRIQRELKITMVYVTHDQEEALALADKIAVMNKGVIEQVGSPEEVYNNPQTPFVASFLGRTTVLTGQVVSVEDGLAKVKIGNSILEAINHGVREGEEALVIIKADVLDGERCSKVKGKVKMSMYLGSEVEVILGVDGKEIAVRIPKKVAGETVEVCIPVRNVHAFKKNSVEE